MTRREFPARIKVAAYERAGGGCEECGMPLRVGKTHYDHVLPDALGGEPTLDNCAVLCSGCHAAKTARVDIPRIAKTKRIQAKHLGAKKTSKFRRPDGVRFDWRVGRYVKETA